jgi:hypothetical protein
MERQNETADVVDLGAASIETQGAVGPNIELSSIGRFNGISDD